MPPNASLAHRRCRRLTRSSLKEAAGKARAQAIYGLALPDLPSKATVVLEELVKAVSGISLPTAYLFADLILVATCFGGGAAGFAHLALGITRPLAITSSRLRTSRLVIRSCFISL